MQLFSLVMLMFANLSARATVESVLSMQREQSGAYSVVCDMNGAITYAKNISAHAIRSNQVCLEEPGAIQLEVGHYMTTSDFCGQTVQWGGGKLELVLDSPCQGTVQLEIFQENWYRGKLEGYSYVYEVQVTGPKAYTFYSRDFSTQGDFIFGQSGGEPLGRRPLRTLPPASFGVIVALISAKLHSRSNGDESLPSRDHLFFHRLDVAGRSFGEQAVS